VENSFFKKTIRLFANFNSIFYLCRQKKKKTMMTSSMLIHPGEMIKDEIEARGLTQKELATQMGVSYTVFNEILNGKRPVTTEYALLLEAALGTNASIWIGLQADYNMQKAKQDKSFMKRLEKIRKIAAVF
jgi:addiction module HigA family antidote